MMFASARAVYAPRDYPARPYSGPYSGIDVPGRSPKRASVCGFLLGVTRRVIPATSSGSSSGDSSSQRSVAVSINRRYPASLEQSVRSTCSWRFYTDSAAASSSGSTDRAERPA